MPRQVQWWQEGIIYQIYPLSFQDSNGDGLGDLGGVLQRLDYLKWLGVTAIWLTPIYESPMRDYGYDVMDHRKINPVFGDMDDFERLAEAIHRRDMKLILDYVPNHTSDIHPWFLESSSSRENPKRDWYIWRDPAPDGGPPNNWVSHFGGSAWEWDEQTQQYFYHAFLKEQPDLNWRNREVREAMYDVMRFWLEKGADGFRMDVLYEIVKDEMFRDDPPNPDWHPGQGPHDQLLHVYSSDRPEVHDIVHEMRDVLESYGDGVMIAEIWLPLEQLVTYYGNASDGTHLPLNFQLIQTQWSATRIKEIIRTYESLVPIGDWPNWVLGNHDTKRVAARVGRAQARVAAFMLLMLRGTPTMYYGDEIGMIDVPIPWDMVRDGFERNVPGLGLGRDPARTPMQWTEGTAAGFSTGRPWLPISSDSDVYNVQDETEDPGSILNLYRLLIGLRAEHPALRTGSYEEFPTDGHVVAWFRGAYNERFFIALNLTSESQVFDIGDMRCTQVLDTLCSCSAQPLTGQVTLAGNEGVIAKVE